MSRNKLSRMLSYICILVGIVFLIPRVMLWMMPSFPTGNSGGSIELQIRLFFNPNEPTGLLALVGIPVVIFGICLLAAQKFRK